MSIIFPRALAVRGSLRAWRSRLISDSKVAPSSSLVASLATFYTGEANGAHHSDTPKCAAGKEQAHRKETEEDPSGGLFHAFSLSMGAFRSPPPPPIATTAKPFFHVLQDQRNRNEAHASRAISSTQRGTTSAAGNRETTATTMEKENSSRHEETGPVTSGPRPSSSSFQLREHPLHQRHASPLLVAPKKTFAEKVQREVKRGTKKAAMKLTSLLSNHRHDKIDFTHTRESRGEIAREVRGGQRAFPHAQPLQSGHREKGACTEPHPTDKSSVRDVPEVSAVRSRTGFAISSVSPAVLKAQAAVAAAAEEKKKQQAENVTHIASSEPNNSVQTAVSAGKGSCCSKDDTKKSGRLDAGMRDSPSISGSGGTFRKVYREHRLLGWSPRQLYDVVSDVNRYHEFIPWCVSSVVHSTVPLSEDKLRALADSSRSDEVGGRQANSHSTDGIPHVIGSNPSIKFQFSRSNDHKSCTSSAAGPSEMTATLTVGFAFLKEEYTSQVTLEPPHRIVATLKDPAMGGEDSPSTAPSAPSANSGFFSSIFRRATRNLPVPRGSSGTPSSVSTTSGGGSSSSVLRQLRCEWSLDAVPHDPNTVEVRVTISFEFRHQMYGALIMSNIVSLMTSSFERRCEALFGPPSQPSKALE